LENLEQSHELQLTGMSVHIRTCKPAGANPTHPVHALVAVGAVLLQWWMWEVVVLLAGLLPNAEVAVAVTGLSTQIQTIPWILCYSLGTATATRVAQALGAGDADKAARLCRWVGWGGRSLRPGGSLVAAWWQPGGSCVHSRSEERGSSRVARKRHI
jgi:hypothetical protein